MDSEKGFTLVEVLAVVMILSITYLVVTPLITGSIKESKDKLYEIQLENIKSAARLHMINFDLEDGETTTITLDALKKYGLVEKDIKNPKTGNEFNSCMLVKVKRIGDIYEYDVITEDDCIEN